MRFVSANLTVIFWSFIFGMIIGYIGGALSGASVNYIQAGIIASIVAVCVINGIRCISSKV